MPDTLLAHLGPLGWEHISFNGDYFWPSESFKDGFVRCEIPAPRSSMLLSVLKQIIAMTLLNPEHPGHAHAKFSSPMIFLSLDHEQAGSSARGLGDSSSRVSLSFFSAVPRFLLTAAQPIDFRRNPISGKSRAVDIIPIMWRVFRQCYTVR